jgi:hypothetical protein
MIKCRKQEIWEFMIDAALEEIAYQDYLGRKISQSSRDNARRLLKDLDESKIPLPCIYLQWKNASVYIYENFFVFLDDKIDIWGFNDYSSLFDKIKSCPVIRH